LNLLPKHKKLITDYIKNKLTYGYKCSMCDENAIITCAYADKDCFDYVGFQCPKCKRRWGMEFKHGELKELIVA